jgi:hypothetical protein
VRPDSSSDAAPRLQLALWRSLFASVWAPRESTLLRLSSEEVALILQRDRGESETRRAAR